MICGTTSDQWPPTLYCRCWPEICLKHMPYILGSGQAQHLSPCLPPSEVTIAGGAGVRGAVPDSVAGTAGGCPGRPLCSAPRRSPAQPPSRACQYAPWWSGPSLHRLASAALLLNPAPCGTPGACGRGTWSLLVCRACEPCASICSAAIHWTATAPVHVHQVG